MTQLPLNLSSDHTDLDTKFDHGKPDSAVRLKLRQRMAQIIRKRVHLTCSFQIDNFLQHRQPSIFLAEGWILRTLNETKFVRNRLIPDRRDSE